MEIEQFTKDTVADPEVMNEIIDIVNKNSSQMWQNAEAIGEIASLTTTAKSNVVVAINEVDKESMSLISTPTDLNNFSEVNKWCLIGGASLVLNVPSASSAYNNSAVYNFGQANNVFQQFYYAPQARKTFVRDYVGWHATTKWTAWKEIATTETTTLTLINGWGGTMKASKTGDTVTIYCDIQSGIFASNTVISNLPISMRSSRVSYCAVQGSSNRAFLLQINVNGDITINYFANPWDSSQKVGGISFVI